jgi:hypothetical protein
MDVTEVLTQEFVHIDTILDFSIRVFLRITPSLVPVELSPTHCPRVNLVVSLKDCPPTSPETVQIFDTLSRHNVSGGSIGAHIIRESVLSLSV